MAIAYEPVIGLEVHAQLLTASKLFSSASASYGAPPNTNISPLCLALPGALPVPNREAIRLAVRAAVALELTVQRESRFDRKHYFYPDLPKGYQISQYDRPVALEGGLEVESESGPRRIRIQRIHLEEDAAKNLHDTGSRNTQVDFNRAGVPLIEIVSHPDLRSAAEAESYLRRLREVLMFAGVNDGNLEEGSFRCDANVSIRPVGQEKFGTRVELKNINSFRFVRKAIEHEIARQEAVLGGGGAVVQETRTWVDAQGKTLPMRGKEEAHDYRYFPDPDLPALVLEEAEIRTITDGMPELPAAKRARWIEAAGLTEYDAQVLSGHPQIAAFFDTVADGLVARWGEPKRAHAGKRAANFIQAEVLRGAETEGLRASFAVAPEALIELLDLVEGGTINGKIAKDIYAEMTASGDGPKAIIEAKGLAQVVDAGAIEDEVRRIVDAHPKQAAEFRAGKETLLGFFVGQVMKATKGKANPQVVNDLVRKLLAG